MPRRSCNCDVSQAGTVSIRVGPEPRPLVLSKGEQQTQVVSFCQPGNSEEILIPVVVSGPSGPGVPEKATRVSPPQERLQALYDAIRKLDAERMVIPLAPTLSDGCIRISNVCKFDIRAGKAAAEAIEKQRSGRWGEIDEPPVDELWFRFGWNNPAMLASIPPPWDGNAVYGLDPPARPGGSGSGNRAAEVVPTGVRLSFFVWSGAHERAIPVARQAPAALLCLTLFGERDDALWFGALRQWLPMRPSAGVASIVARAASSAGWRARLLGEDTVILFGPEGVRVVAADFRVALRDCTARSIHVEVGAVVSDGPGSRTAGHSIRAQVAPPDAANDLALYQRSAIQGVTSAVIGGAPGAHEQERS